MLGHSHLVGMGYIVKRGSYSADAIAICIPSKAIIESGDAANLYALAKSDAAQYLTGVSDAVSEVNHCS